MARQKEFDREDVLQKAMDVFWSQGYEATSIQDLVEAMGINRGSLYDTFKDKQTLFRLALAHYDDTIISQAIAKLEAPGASKLETMQFFYRLVEDAVADSRRRGCLITNSAVELAATDPEMAERIAANLKRLEMAFYRALARARDKGEIAKNDLWALARFCVTCAQGLRVIAKVNPASEALQDTVRVVETTLE